MEKISKVDSLFSQYIFASKNEIYLQEIYQSSNQEMFAISLSSCSRYNANFKLDMTVRHIFEISEDNHPRTVSHARDHW